MNPGRGVGSEAVDPETPFDVLIEEPAIINDRIDSPSIHEGMIVIDGDVTVVPIENCEGVIEQILVFGGDMC